MKDYIITQKKISKNQIQKYFIENINLFPRIVSGEIIMEDYINKISNYSIHFCAIYEKKIRGFLAVYFNSPNKEFGFMTTLSIQENHQRNGLAKKLMNDAIKYASANGFKKLKLEVDKNNHVAIKLYSSLGFEIIEETAHSFYMILSLNNLIA